MFTCVCYSLGHSSLDGTSHVHTYTCMSVCVLACMQADRLLKFKVINDTLNAVSPPEWLPFTEPSVLPPDMAAELAAAGPEGFVPSAAMARTMLDG